MVYRIAPDQGVLGVPAIFQLDGQQTDGTTWLQAEIPISNSAGVFRIAIETVRGTDRFSDIAIDDVATTFPISERELTICLSG